MLFRSLDRLGGIARLGLAVGHDHGDGVADVAHRIERHHRVRWRLVRLTVLVLDDPTADQATHLGVGRVLAGEDRHHARARDLHRGDRLKPAHHERGHHAHHRSNDHSAKRQHLNP